MATKYIIATSRSSEDKNSNSSVQFRNNLPTDINVQKHKLALQSIFIDSKFGNIPTTIRETVDHFVLLDTEYNHVKSMSLKYPKLTIEEIVWLLNKQTDRNLCYFSIGATKRLQIELSNSVLLFHPTINIFFGLEGTEAVYNNEVFYFLENTAQEKKVFIAEKKLSMKPLLPKMIKVKLEEMEPSLSTQNNSQIIGIICGDKEIAKYPLFNVVLKKEYVDVLQPTLNTITITLLDENNRPLCLEDGEQTIVKLKLQATMFDSFILRIASNECRDIYPNNTNSNFRIQLSRPLRTQDRQWEVALSSICLPAKMSDKKLLENVWIEFSFDNITYDRLSFDDQVPPITTEKVFLHMKEYLETIFFDMMLQLLTDADNIIMMRGKADTTYIRTSSKFAALFNIKETYFSIRKEEEITLGFFDIRRLDPKILYLYCNFIHPVVIGEKRERILKLLPFTHNNKDVITKYESQHLDFMPLSLNDPYLLHFELCTYGNNPIQFDNENALVLINLIFREA